ncbi:MAG: response regulator [Desulfobacteraceae bacterium]
MKTNNKVLVVDDESHIRRVIEVKLKKYGFDVIYAPNGSEGLKVLEKEKPSVMITDINMPVMDGRELCEKSDSYKNDWSFLTVIITARINPEDRTWVSEMTDTIFLEKPFSTSVLKDKIETYLEG